MDPRPITLGGRRVRLEPLAPVHAPDLLDALARDPSIFQWMTTEPPLTPAAMDAWVADALAAQAAGGVVCFAQIAVADGRAVGSTRYMDIRRAERALEIGGTWLGRPWQRTGINTEAKYLLLRHAFEELGAERVQLKTDARNQQSQAAIARLGAVEEGTLRRYQRTRGGGLRDTVMFSVIAEEWSAVRGRLEGWLAG